MKTIEQLMKYERESGSPCELSIMFMATGKFRALMTFAPGMQSARGEGATVADAIAQLEKELIR